MIKYYSTNRNSKLTSFKEALLSGQAPDKGLYMPNFIPQISPAQIVSFKDLPYWEVAFSVTKEFLKDEIPEDELKKILRGAYSTHNFEIPIENVFGMVYLMRLGEGPTASFKDFAARMMAYLMEYFIGKEKRNLLILVATSGDTGSAVANAFLGLENIKMVVLFPAREVTEKQRKQMTTLGKNITAIAVDGKFDDCQAMVRWAFADPELSDLNLSSANSIDFGRLLPQTVYYFYAYSKLAKKGEKIIFSIPSGNFGNLVGGLIAKRMGLPVYKFIVAVNENDEFPKFLETGKYQSVRPSRNCLSNSMNIGHPSNLARLIDLYGGEMNERGEIRKMPNLDLIKKDILSLSISDNETRMTMKKVYQKYGKILEPHGAVGFAALERFLSETKEYPLSVSLETAHPGKFPETIKEVLNVEPEPLGIIKELENKKETFENISLDYEDFKKFLKEKFQPH